MEIIETADFDSALGKLQLDARRLYAVQKERFCENWRDPRLHIKKVKGLNLAFSFRVTRNYRVLFYFQDNDTAIFFDVDHRKDVYQ